MSYKVTKISSGETRSGLSYRDVENLRSEGRESDFIFEDEDSEVVSD